MFLDINFFRYESVRKEMLGYIQKLRKRNIVIYIPMEDDIANVDIVTEILSRSKKV